MSPVPNRRVPGNQADKDWPMTLSLTGAHTLMASTISSDIIEPHLSGKTDNRKTVIGFCCRYKVFGRLGNPAGCT